MADHHEDQIDCRYYGANRDCVGHEGDQQGADCVDEELGDPEPWSDGDGLALVLHAPDASEDGGAYLPEREPLLILVDQLRKGPFTKLGILARVGVPSAFALDTIENLHSYSIFIFKINKQFK